MLGLRRPPDMTTEDHEEEGRSESRDFRSRELAGHQGLIMRLLVTGHKGYIGTVMVLLLLGAGHEVVGLDSDLFQQCTFNQALNVGQTEENYRVRELAEIVRGVVPGSRIEYAADGGPDSRCYRVDFGRISRLLPEWKPQWNTRRGAEELYAAYRSAGLVLEDCEGPRFKRIDHLKQLLATGRVDPTLRWRAA